MRNRLWRVQPFDVEAAAELSVQADISPLVAHLLLTRGIHTPEEALAFLHPSPAQTHDPLLLPNIEAAVARLRQALDAGQQITIYGDYDVDGTTATALLLTVLRGLGGEVDYYIPDRASEGYGVNSSAMARIKEAGADLLLTVDCGVTAREPIEEAHRLGLDVIVTDHHSIDPDRLPTPGTAVAVIDPKLPGHEYPFQELAGVGLAFKIAHALVGGDLEGGNPVLLDQLDLVALGTIADVAEMRDENRALARLGLDVLNRRERLGIAALCEAAGVTPETRLSSYHVGYVLGPRINAAGRLDTADKVVELLTTRSKLEAFEVATRLNDENDARRRVERQMTDEAMEMVKTQRTADGDAAIVVAREGWHPGVVGLVASRLSDRFWRPSLAIALDGDMGRGSGRSIPEFDLHAGLLECREWMVTFGGHAAAAGMTVDAKALPNLTEAFHRVARTRLTDHDLRPKLRLDAILPLDELHLAAVQEMDCLEPFGEGNTHPAVGIRGLRLMGAPRRMGAEGRHLSAQLTDGERSIRAVAWDGAQHAVPLRAPDVVVGVAGRVDVNDYQGNRSVQISVRDWDLGTSQPAAEPHVYPSRERPAWVRIVDRRVGVEKGDHIREVVARGEPTLILVRNDYAVVQARDLLSARGLGERTGHCAEAADDAARDEAVQRFQRAEWDAFITTTDADLGGDAHAWQELRHVIFCHPTRTEAAFIRAARPALLPWSDEVPPMEAAREVHLLFGRDDVAVDTRQLLTECPDDAMLRRVYRALPAGPPGIGETQWRDALAPADAPALSNATRVLDELRLIQGDGPWFRAKAAERRELTDSTMFRQHAVKRRAWELQAARWIKQTPQDFWELFRRCRNAQSDPDDTPVADRSGGDGEGGV